MLLSLYQWKIVSKCHWSVISGTIYLHLLSRQGYYYIVFNTFSILFFMHNIAKHSWWYLIMSPVKEFQYLLWIYHHSNLCWEPYLQWVRFPDKKALPLNQSIHWENGRKVKKSPLSQLRLFDFHFMRKIAAEWFKHWPEQGRLIIKFDPAKKLRAKGNFFSLTTKSFCPLTDIVCFSSLCLSWMFQIVKKTFLYKDNLSKCKKKVWIIYLKGRKICEKVKLLLPL